jgi:two-component system nitrogen regulation response regulator NtrX
MSLKTQAKILRILQEQRFERVGGTVTMQVDVRIIAATNKDLAQEIKDGRFREDLYYRLNVIPVQVPPLRERREDIPLLVAEFLRETAVDSGLKQKRITERAIEIIVRQPWQGNVRELRNLIERLVILVPDEVIDVHHLAECFPLATPDSSESALDQPTFRQARTEFERQYLRRKLAEHNWNISQTAEAIGLERSHLHRKIKSYGVEPQAETS